MKPDSSNDQNQINQERCIDYLFKILEELTAQVSQLPLAENKLTKFAKK